MASGETPSNNELKNPDDWRVEEPEEAKYNFTDEKGVWQPKPEDILSLFEKLAQGGPLPLKWQCPGRRPPRTKEEEAEEKTMVDADFEKEEEKEEKEIIPEASAFDFDEFSGDPNTKLTPIRAPGGTGRTPRTKKRACMDNIMDSLRKQHLQTVAEREARRARGSPSAGTPKSRIFSMKRTTAPSSGAASGSVATASPNLAAVSTTTSGAITAPSIPPVVSSSTQPTQSSLMSEPIPSDSSVSGFDSTSTSHPGTLPDTTPKVTTCDTDLIPSVSTNPTITTPTAHTTTTSTSLSDSPQPSTSSSTPNPQATGISPEMSSFSLQRTNQIQPLSVPAAVTTNSSLPAVNFTATSVPPVSTQETAPLITHSTFISTSTENISLAPSSTMSTLTGNTALTPLSTMSTSTRNTDLAPLPTATAQVDSLPGNSKPKMTMPTSQPPVATTLNTGTNLVSSSPVGSAAQGLTSTTPDPVTMSSSSNPTNLPKTPSANTATPPPPPPLTATSTIPSQPLASPPPLLPPPYSVTAPPTTAASDPVYPTVSPSVSTPLTHATGGPGANTLASVASSQQPQPPPQVPSASSEPTQVVSKPPPPAVEPTLMQPELVRAEVESVKQDVLVSEKVTGEMAEDTKIVNVDEKS